MPPFDKDWYYIRIASIARQLYIRTKGIGIRMLSRFYGGRKRNLVKKKHFSLSSRGIIRFALNTLTHLGFVELVEVNDKQLRKLTPKGKADLDNVSTAFIIKNEIDFTKIEEYNKNMDYLERNYDNLI